MAAFGRTIGFIRKFKAKFAVLLLLDILFAVIFVILVAQRIPEISSHLAAYDKIMEDASGNDYGTLGRLSSHSDEIVALQDNLNSIMMRLTFWALLSANIIFGIFFAIFLGKFKSWYIVKFVCINSIAQVVLLFIFEAIVDVKGAISGNVVAESQSNTSMFVFIAIAYITYFFMLVYFVEMRNERAFANTAKIIKSNLLWLTVNYIVVNILFWIILVLTQIPIFSDIYGVWFISACIGGSIVFVMYNTLSKIYLIEKVISCEKR